MTFFVKLYKIIKIIGFIVLLVMGSYILTSVVYYSLNKEKEIKYPISIIENEYIEVIDIENKEVIILEVELKEETKKEYLIAYSLTYFDIYNKEVHLFVINKNFIVSIGTNEIITFSEWKKFSKKPCKIVFMKFSFKNLENKINKFEKSRFRIHRKRVKIRKVNSK